MMRQFELVELVRAYDPNTDEDALNRAYVFSMKAHGHQKRASGDPYFSHPLEVAGILTGMRLDSASIITALLHDTVEDTEATLEEIEHLFGAEIARLVDGVTKLSRLELQSENTKHAENFRKLVLAMSEDIRVLLVKLADRLHNMRTLHYMKSPEKRRRIALETMEIYAPLAERIGMHEIKDELEDCAFAEINPDARRSILKRLEFLRSSGRIQVEEIVEELTQELRAAGLEPTISGREKRPYSIWRKMERKNISFEQLADIMAFRVLVGSVGDCYQALGVLHSRYTIVPGRFKDYISLPKPNGYQSIHTVVIGPQSQRIEMQVRTMDMHRIAEIGVAAHWRYKEQGGSFAGTARESPQYAWLRDLRDLLEHASSPEEFLEHTKLAMYQDQVFCFTPRGDLINLPYGATPVDFAYAVHSEVGNSCCGSKINGRIRPLRTELRNGDQIEIQTAKNQTPSPEWERFVVTAKARSSIRRFVRGRERTEHSHLGKAILQKVFREEGYEFTEKLVEGVLAQFNCPTTDDLYAQVGQGNHTGRQVLRTVFPTPRQTAVPIPDPIGGIEEPIATPRAKGGNGANGGTVSLNGLVPGMAMHFARCCHPLPGDRIVGIVSTGRGVTIHTIDCESLARFTDEPERWLDVSWEANGAPDQEFTGRLHAEVDNSPGALGELCSTIGRNSGNISNLKITNRTNDYFEMLIDIEVQDVRHLTSIMAALRSTPAINSVDRARGS